LLEVKTILKEGSKKGHLLIESDLRTEDEFGELPQTELPPLLPDQLPEFLEGNGRHQILLPFHGLFQIFYQGFPRKIGM
jgi:hypothetical protein